MSEDVLEVAVAELRPSLEALLMIADQPLDETTLATAVGYPVGGGRRPRSPRSPRSTPSRAAGFELRNVAGGWRYYTREEFAAGRRGVRPRRPAGPADPGRPRDAGRGRLPAAGVAGPGLGDPRRQRRRRDAHPAHPRPGRGGRAATTPRAPTSTAPPRYFLERIGVTSLDDLPELAPYLPTSTTSTSSRTVGPTRAAPAPSAQPSPTADRSPTRPTRTAWSGCTSCSPGRASPRGASARS